MLHYDHEPPDDKVPTEVKFLVRTVEALCFAVLCLGLYLWLH